jgi:adenylosuccinate lyase
MDVWQSKKNFKEVLEGDAEVTAVLSNDDLDNAFDPTKSLRYVDYIFERVGLGK